MNSPNQPFAPEPETLGDRPSHEMQQRYWQPLIAYIVLIGLCLHGIVRNHALNLFGHLLGEHWDSIYNILLATAATMLFVTARLRRDSSIAWRVFDLTIMCMIVSWGLKGTFPHMLRPSGGEHGFPSGHSLTAFAASWLLMAVFPKLSPIAFLIATAVGWSRVEIGEHYTYQVLSGAPMGMAIGYFVTTAKPGVGVVLPRIFQRKKKIAA